MVRTLHQALDESGIAGFACSIDRDPDGMPDKTVSVKPHAVFEASFPEDGTWYVHARALDNAGNWSQPGHFTYVVSD